MKKLFVVTVNSEWIRDSQFFDINGLSQAEMQDIDTKMSETAYDDRWRDYEPCDYLGCVWAEDAEKAVQKIAAIQHRDPRQLSALAAEDAAWMTEQKTRESMIFTVMDDDTLRRYPVAGFADQSLEMIWNSQKCWFSKGVAVTIIAPDGREETFRR